jgi:hypothetical protein
MQIRAFAIGLALALATIGGARAADVVFTITGGGQTATFELPLNPTLDPTVDPIVPGLLFEFPSVPAVIAGSPVTLTNLIFWEAGGFSDDHYFSFAGPTFYKGSESSPTFRTDLSPVTLPNEGAFGGKMDLVTVVDPPPPPLAVPELSTWAMLLLGFFGLSYAGYRKAGRRTSLLTD